MSNLPNMTDQQTKFINRLPQRNDGLVAEAVKGYATGFVVTLVGIVWIGAVQNICTKWKGFK
jgi:tetrahydromethanopterin S-methyltransferase subunit F